MDDFKASSTQVEYHRALSVATVSRFPAGDVDGARNWCALRMSDQQTSDGHASSFNLVLYLTDQAQMLAMRATLLAALDELNATIDSFGYGEPDRDDKSPHRDCGSGDAAEIHGVSCELARGLFPPPISEPTFNADLVRIIRYHVSTTQGEVSLWYGDRHVGRFGDRYTIDDGAWSGRSDAYWVEAARKCVLGLPLPVGAVQ